MKNSFVLQRDFTFISIIILGISYVSFITVTFFKVINGCLMQLILLTERLSNPIGNTWELVTSSKFLSHTIVGMLTLFLILWMIRGLVKMGIQIKKTKKFTSSLDIVENIYQKRVSVFQNEKALVFTAGILQPRIYISTRIWKAFSKKQIDTILLHEESHVKSRDPLKNIIVNLVKYITPPFLLKKEFFESYSLLTELSCDAYCESKFESKKPVVDSLLALLHIGDEIGLTGVSNFFSHGNRVSILVGKSKFKTKRLLLQVMIFWGILIASLSWASKTKAFSSCDHLDECFSALFSSSTVDLQNSSAVCGDHASEHLMSIDKSNYEKIFQTSLKSL